MLLFYIENLLVRALGALDLFPLTLVIDLSRFHNMAMILEAFHENGCQKLQTIYFVPSNAAKRMSSLDNSSFNEWKESIKKRRKITKDNIAQVMSDEWNNTTKNSLRAHYRYYGLIHGRDPYFDCPDPSAHAHHTRISS